MRASIFGSIEEPMSVRYQSLTPRQLVVLQWIAEGCPDGTWPDDSHKISARALETRNLATVSRRGGRWHATIKSDGTYYLTHGQYPKEPPPTHDRTESPASIVGSRDEIDVDDLIARLRTGSPIRVEAPTPGVRAAYRRAISAAITGGKVPTGLTLLHTGRDHGNLVISLIEAQPPTPKPAPIPIPNTHDPDQPAIRHLLENGSHWAVSPDARPRAFTLIQALADEATRRGHQVSERHAETSTFRIDIGEDSYPFLLTEEHDKGDQIPQEQLDAAKYSWQRVSLRPAMIPSGRLTLQLQHGSRHPHWADRQRWRLDEKLAAVMEQIEQHAAGHANSARTPRLNAPATDSCGSRQSRGLRNVTSTTSTPSGFLRRRTPRRRPRRYSPTASASPISQRPSLTLRTVTRLRSGPPGAERTLRLLTR